MKEVKLQWFTRFFKSNYINIFISFAIIFSYSFETTAGNDPFSAVVSSSLTLKINVRTNINSFICNYNSLINDTIPYIYNTKNNKYYLSESKYQIPIKNIDCHNSIMNDEMQEMFNASKNPNIIIKINNIYIDKKALNDGKVQLSLTINNVENLYYVNFKFDNKNNISIISSDISINLSDFKVIPPSKAFGLIQVENTININFALNLKIKKNDKLYLVTNEN